MDVTRKRMHIRATEYTVTASKQVVNTATNVCCIEEALLSFRRDEVIGNDLE